MGASRTDIGRIENILKTYVKDYNLEEFFREGQIRNIAITIARFINHALGTLCTKWQISQETGFDLAKQALYDVVFLKENSRHGQQELDEVLNAATLISELFGFSIRSVNSKDKGDQMFQGETPLAQALYDEILLPMLQKREDTIKPLYVIILTGGAVR